MYAIQCNNVEIVSLLLQDKNIDITQLLVTKKRKCLASSHRYSKYDKLY